MPNGVSATMEVDGVAEVLRALGRVDPELRKATVKNMKAAGEPMAAAARSLLPPATPLSNWGNWTTPKGRVIGPYDASKARRGVKVAYRGSKVRGSDKNVIPLLTLRQTDATGVIVDMAGRRSGGNSPQGAAFIRGLNRNGVASRTMWPAAERHMTDVHRAVEDAINDMSDKINEELR
jgi:hypothetical protein